MKENAELGTHACFQIVQYIILDRFHGAFTGGFSAGYFNSVGTKEGWTPSTFVSSKGQRAETKRARPQDFMDDEVSARFYISLSTLLLKCPSIVHMSLDVLVVPFCYGYLTYSLQDLGEFGISPQVIQATSNFDSNRDQIQRKRVLDPSGAIPGVPVLEEILRPARCFIFLLLYIVSLHIM